MDKSESSIIKTITIETTEEDDLSTRDKLFDFILSPKCPLCGRSTVYIFKQLWKYI